MKCIPHVLLAVMLSTCPAVAQNDATMQRVDAILKQLTLEEKVSLCRGNSTMSINAIPRVGIPREFVMSDGPHTVRPDIKRHSFGHRGGNQDTSTTLPSLVALAATWDTTLAATFGHLLGRECRDRGKDMLLGPGVNILRTPLCGRNWEYLGEDPYLAAAMAVPYIKAVQSHDVAACVKHYAVNNQERNRHRMSVSVEDRALREIYLPAFEAAVKDAKVLTVMNAYNKFRGTFCSHSDLLNNQILKGEWGFKGFIVTDWGSLHDTVAGALGGTDVEMNAGRAIRYFKQPLLDAVKAGDVPEAVIDDKARRVLYVMAQTSMIDPSERAKGARNTPEHQATARKVAAEAVVLLKNERNLLPLNPEALKTVVVLGPNAVDKHCRGGNSAEGKPPYEITPLEGLRQRLGDTVRVDYLNMPHASEDAAVDPIPDTALLTVDSTAQDRGIAIKAWKADYFANADLAGEPLFSRFDRQINFNWGARAPRAGLPADGYSCRWEAEVEAPETGTYVLAVSMDDGARVKVDGQTVVDGWADGPRRQVRGTTDLQAGERYRITVEYYERSGGASVSFGWQAPTAKGQEAVRFTEAVRTADAVIVFTGSSHHGGEAREQEGDDLGSMALRRGEAETVARALALNRNTLVINRSGTPLELPFAGSAHTLMQYWYSGQEGGHALAAVLCGDVNPSGKLPFTWPQRLGDTPAHSVKNGYSPHVSHYREGILVGYRWYDAKAIEPLFPFGYGLSYTTFEIGPPRLSAHELARGDSLEVSVDVKNTGARAGAEVVQLYVADTEASVLRPPQELKGFRKVFLNPSERKTVTMTLTPRDLSFWDDTTDRWKAEPGEFIVRVGNASRSIAGEARFTLTD